MDQKERLVVKRASPASSPISHHQPDSPIDLSQLSTRRCTSNLMDRSASESCLASSRPSSSTPIIQPKRRRLDSSSKLPPLLEHHRSVSSAELSGPNYRTPWPTPESGRAQPLLGPPPPPPPPVDSLRMRCMSESRLGAGQAVDKRILPVGNEEPERNSQLEFLLRRTASESNVQPSSRSGDGTSSSSMAMEMFKRQQQVLQQHYQQLLLQQDRLPGSSSSLVDQGSSGSSSSSPSSNNYLAAAASSPWLYLGLFGYSQMIQAQFHQTSPPQPMQSSHHHHLHHDSVAAATSGQISAGPSSPAVAASASGSDGEGAPEEDEEDDEDDDGGGGSGDLNGHGKKRSPRALTGKHVRLGTGASPQTLNTLRLKIQERMKLGGGGGKTMLKNGLVLPAGKAGKNGNNKLKGRAK